MTTRYSSLPQGAQEREASRHDSPHPGVKAKYRENAAPVCRASLRAGGDFADLSYSERPDPLVRPAAVELPDPEARQYHVSSGTRPAHERCRQAIRPEYFGQFRVTPTRIARRIDRYVHGREP